MYLTYKLDDKVPHVLSMCVSVVYIININYIFFSLGIMVLFFYMTLDISEISSLCSWSFSVPDLWRFHTLDSDSLYT